MSTTKRKVCKMCRQILPADKDHFYFVAQKQPGVYYPGSYCIKCDNERTKKYKNKNKKKVKKTAINYLQTELGYMTEKYHSMKRSRHGCSLTKEEFFECWEQQKAKTGWKCPYYPWVTMTMIRGKTAQDKTLTNLSVDRILSDFPYSKHNIMFVSWDANQKKGSVDPYLATKYLDFVNANEKIRRLTETKISLQMDQERLRSINDILTIDRIISGIDKKVDDAIEAHNKIYKPLIEADLVSYDSEEDRKIVRKSWGIEDKKETKH